MEDQLLKMIFSAAELAAVVMVLTRVFVKDLAETLKAVLEAARSLKRREDDEPH
jgi:hypothetical protein